MICLSDDQTEIFERQAITIFRIDCRFSLLLLLFLLLSSSSSGLFLSGFLFLSRIANEGEKRRETKGAET